MGDGVQMRRGLGEREDALTQAAPLLVDPDHLQPTKVGPPIDFLGRITLDVWQALSIVAIAVLLDLSRDLVGPAAQDPDFILGQETAYNQVAVGAEEGVLNVVEVHFRVTTVFFRGGEGKHRNYGDFCPPANRRLSS